VGSGLGSDGKTYQEGERCEVYLELRLPIWELELGSNEAAVVLNASSNCKLKTGRPGYQLKEKKILFSNPGGRMLQDDSRN